MANSQGRPAPVCHFPARKATFMARAYVISSAFRWAYYVNPLDWVGLGGFFVGPNGPDFMKQLQGPSP